MKETSVGGFSLIELMITIAILAVLMAIAVPNFQSIIKNNSISTQANEFISGLALARSEAIKRGSSVRVTALGADYSSGWTVWADADGDNVIDSGEKIRVHEALKTGYTLVGTGFTNTKEIQYRSNGVVNSSGYFTLCYSGYSGRQISISTTGRVSVTATAAICS